MRNWKRALVLTAIAVANLAFVAQRATASDLLHTAAWDPAQNKWIVVCTQCIIACNCTAGEE